MGVSMRAELVALLGAAALATGCGVAGAFGGRVDPARYETPVDPQARAAFDEALVCIQAEAEDRAVVLLAEVVRSSPDFVPGHVAYQDAAIRLGGSAEADMRRHYEGLTSPSWSPVVPYVQARILSSPFLQRQTLEEILTRDASFYYAHLSLGRLMRAHGRLTPAISSLRAALALQPNLLEAQLELAETLMELGQDEEAAVHFANYLRATPNDLSAARRYVHLLVYRLQRLDEALGWIERFLGRDPGDHVALLDKAAAMWWAGRPMESLTIYLAALRLRPDSARAVLNIAYLYYDVLAADEASRQRYWPKARMAFLLYLKMARPEDGMDYLEQHLVVPYRLKRIADALGPIDPAVGVTIADLEPG